MDERDVDERFRDIIAHWDAPVEDAQADDAAGPRMPPAGEPAPSGPVAPPAGPNEAGEDPPPTAAQAWSSVVVPPSVWRGPSAPSVDDDEGHFEPPTQIVLPPQEDLHYWGSLIGLVLGPLLLVWVAYARPFYMGWWVAGGIGLFVGGFLLLVLRRPGGRPDDDDGGAQV